MGDEEFNLRVHRILSRQLGLYRYARFLQLFLPGSGDYTRDRQQWLDEISIDEVIAETKKLEHADRPELNLPNTMSSY